MLPARVRIVSVLLVLFALGCPGEDQPDPEELDRDYTVNKTGDGFGTVASQEGGINCGPLCPSQTTTRTSGSDFSITATAEVGSTFDGWSGPGCQTTDLPTTTATVSPSELNNVCTAAFSLLPGQTFTLEVVKSGSGAAGGTVNSTGGAIQCGATCTAQFSGGTIVELNATTSGNVTFDGWSGPANDCSGAAATISVLVSGNKTCTAEFSTGAPSTRLEFRAAFRWDRGPQEGMALLGVDDRLVIGGYATVGYLRRINFTSVDTPAGEDEAECSGFLRDVARLSRSPVGPLIQGSSPDAGGCFTQEPLGGAVGLFLNPGRAQVREFTNTDFIAQAYFSPGQVDIINQMTGAMQTVTLSTGRNCVFSIAANDSMAFAVGREGTVGTPTENCNNERRVWAIRRATAAVEWSMDLGGKPRDVAVSPNGRWLYIANFESNLVHRIDVQNQMQTGTIPVPGGPTGVDVDQSGMYVGVTAFTTGRVHIFQTMGGMEVANEDSRGGNPVKILFTRQTTATTRVVAVQNFQDTGSANGSVAFFRFTF